MKPLRYGPKGREKPGLLDAYGQIRDLSGVVKDIDGAVLADLSAVRAVRVDALPLVADDVRLPPDAHKGDWEVEMGVDGLGSQRQVVRRARV